jgi:phospholipid/cholesterol/gamma-HCH transport system ATP-binding protein
MTEALIEVHDLTVGWAGEPPLLVRANFDVQRGEIFALLGVSGAGKSTLLRFLVGLEEPIEGEVTGPGAPRLDGERPCFGMMFQQGALLGSLTVGENVALPLERWTDLPRASVAAIARAKLELVGLAAAEHRLPAEISGGMKKRAAIARAMVLEPVLLFLDEPSSGLDPITAAELDDLIVTLQRSLGLTVIVATHDLGSIFAIADRCLMIDPETRSISALGSPNELKDSDNPRVRAFFHRSARAS